MSSDNSEYTPTTGVVRDSYCDWELQGGPLATYDDPAERGIAWGKRAAEFDRWLAEREREAAARGRYEGFEEAVRRSRYSYEDLDWWRNPYRYGSEGDNQ